MNRLKNFAVTTLVSCGLGLLSNTALAVNKPTNTLNLSLDSMATFINQIPKSSAPILTGSTPLASVPLATKPAAIAANQLAVQGRTNATVFQPNLFPSSMSHQVQGLIAKAKTLIGLPYRYGGNSPVSGFDCSGFMQYIYKQNAGVNLPRRSQDMATAGRYVARGDLQAGDMVFFKTRGAGISHVGMYIGNNQFIHSPRTGKSIEISNLNSGYYAKTFATARRVLSQDA